MKELTLKEPSARCFVQHGEPFTIRFVDGKLEIDYSKSNDSMMKFLADMSGVDPIILGDVSASDYMRLRVAATDLIFGVLGTDSPFEQPAG